MAQVQEKAEPAVRPLLTRADVAAYLGVSRNTLDRLLRFGDLPLVRVGNQTRIDPVDLERWIEEHKVTFPGGPARG
jgi:excisionase family DNA binding protein